jgi:hypothetical protein
LADTLPQASHEYFIVAILPLQTWAAGEPQNLVSIPSAVGLQRLLEVSADAPQFWHVYVIVLLLLFDFVHRTRFYEGVSGIFAYPIVSTESAKLLFFGGGRIQRENPLKNLRDVYGLVNVAS